MSHQHAAAYRYLCRCEPCQCKTEDGCCNCGCNLYDTAERQPAARAEFEENMPDDQTY